LQDKRLAGGVQQLDAKKLWSCNKIAIILEQMDDTIACQKIMLKK
jgi:hypothetical protein